MPFFPLTLASSARVQSERSRPVPRSVATTDGVSLRQAALKSQAARSFRLSRLAVIEPGALILRVV
jgi:hypothetical protein